VGFTAGLDAVQKRKKSLLLPRIENVFHMYYTKCDKSCANNFWGQGTQFADVIKVRPTWSSLVRERGVPPLPVAPQVVVGSYLGLETDYAH
jgi:hypothetical protein